MSDGEGSWGALLRGRNGLRSIALAGGVAVHAVNVYIVTTILPSVVRDIGGLPYYAWNTTLFVMASILGSALSPRLMGGLGPRRAFLAALAVFAVGTAGCASAPDIGWLLASRTVQGLGGGLLLGLSYAAVRLVFEPVLWPRAMVLISSMWGVATLAGPAIGGLFAEAGQWRMAFWSVLPIAAGLALLVQAQLRHTHAPAAQAGGGTPLGRLALLGVAVVVVSMASVSPRLEINVAGVLAGLALTLLVARLDARAGLGGRTSLLPTGSYTLKGLLGPLYACVGLLAVAVSSEVFIPYFLQHIHGMQPLMAGYWAAVLSCGWTLGAFLGAGHSEAATLRLLRGGPALMAASLALMAAMMPWTGVSGLPGSVVWLLPSLLGTGLGIGLCWPHILTRIFHAAPAGQENLASAAIITLQLYAMALGAALAGMLANAAGFTDPGGLAGTRQAAVAVLAALACGPALAAVLARRFR